MAPAADRDGASFGRLLRSHRRAANLTQEGLAARSGLSVEAINTLERGTRREPRAATIELLAEALQLDAAQRAALVVASRPAALDTAPPPYPPPEPSAGIPPDLNVHFVGREAELAEIGRQLERGGRVAIHGLGGVGKTQLAVRYLHLRRERYPDGTFWLRADRAATLVADLASLAWRLGLPEREAPEQERQIEAVIRWLRDHPRWLLVLDNVDPAELETVGRWLPPGLPGHLLLTSRTPMGSVRLGLEGLPLETARRLLLDRSDQRDGAAAAEVAEALGGLPLALEQAAAYLEASGRDLASYAELLRTRLVELMTVAKPEDYPRPVATTWELSFERVERECAAAACLLWLCAYLAPDDIPVSVLHANAAEAPEPLSSTLADEVAFDRAVVTLRHYSLVERRGDGLRVHRLVQAVVRGSLAEAEREAWLAAAIRVLAAGFPDRPDGKPQQWPRCGRLLVHVQAVEQHAGGGAVEPGGLGTLLDRAGIYLWARGEFALGRRFSERAVALVEQVKGVEHPDAAVSLNNLGYLLREHADLAAARSVMERALAIRERAFGPDHVETAESLNDVAGVLRQLGEGAAARQLHERALAIRKRVLGPDHPETANTLNNLGFLFWEQGDLAAALPCQRRALAIRERVLGPDHPGTATSLNNLALLLRDQGQLSAARPLWERALAIRERVLGPDHPRTARCRHNLAGLLARQGDTAAARPLLQRALATLEDALGPEHPLTGESRRALEGLR